MSPQARNRLALDAAAAPTSANRAPTAGGANINPTTHQLQGDGVSALDGANDPLGQIAYRNGGYVPEGRRPHITGIPAGSAPPIGFGDVPHDPETALTTEELNRAVNLIATAGAHRNSSQHLVDLDVAGRAEFIRLALEHNPEGVFQELANAETPEQQAAAASALNAAYERGILSPEDLSQYLGQLDDPAQIGEVLRQTGNPALIVPFAAEVLENLDPRDHHPFVNGSAAALEALAGLPAADLQAFLSDPAYGGGALAESLSIALTDLPPEQPHPVRNTAAVALLLEAGARIQPPTPESLSLFDTLAPQIGGAGEAAREAATTFFIVNGDALLDFRGTNGDGGISLERQAIVRDFIANALVGTPPVSNVEALSEYLAETLGEAHDQLTAITDGTVLSDEQKELARFLGSFVGTLESGIRLGVQLAEQRNQDLRESVTGVVGLIEKLAGRAISVPFSSQVIGAGGDALTNAIVDLFGVEVPDPADYAFHATFGTGFDQPDVATHYETGRNTVGTNQSNPIRAN